MAQNNTRTRRIFGGKPVSGATANPVTNEADQADAETVAVGTINRVFPGPKGHSPWWSYHVNPTSAAGATSTLKFYYSNLPSPDPGTAAHWVDSGITAIDLTSTNDSFATVPDKCPTWIMAQAVIANSSGALWAYVRVGGVEE